MSGNGKVGRFKTIRATADETDTQADLDVISSTAPHTFAMTGILETQSAPLRVIPCARVTVTSHTGGTRVTTITDQAGVFAFINVPVRGRSQVFRISFHAPGWGRLVLLDSFEPGNTVQATEFLTHRSQFEDFSHTGMTCGSNCS